MRNANIGQKHTWWSNFNFPLMELTFCIKVKFSRSPKNVNKKSHRSEIILRLLKKYYVDSRAVFTADLNKVLAWVNSRGRCVKRKRVYLSEGMKAEVFSSFTHSLERATYFIIIPDMFERWIFSLSLSSSDLFNLASCWFFLSHLTFCWQESWSGWRMTIKWVLWNFSFFFEKKMKLHAFKRSFSMNGKVSKANTM